MTKLYMCMLFLFHQKLLQKYRFHLNQIIILDAEQFGLTCTIVENRTHTIECQGINGVINESEVACVYDSGPMQEC